MRPMWWRGLRDLVRLAFPVLLTPEHDCIHGRGRFTHSVPVALVPDVEDRLRKHCVGPQCNVIAEVQRLAEPIRNVKGALSVWRLTEEHRYTVDSKVPI